MLPIAPMSVFIRLQIAAAQPLDLGPLFVRFIPTNVSQGLARKTRFTLPIGLRDEPLSNLVSIEPY